MCMQLGVLHLLQNRALVSWLVKPPTTRELAKATHLTFAQIAKLEECWRSKPNATLVRASSAKCV